MKGHCVLPCYISDWLGYTCVPGMCVGLLEGASMWYAVVVLLGGQKEKLLLDAQKCKAEASTHAKCLFQTKHLLFPMELVQKKVTAKHDL